ncbi:hypothetical protein V8E55_008840 [Tylopilus felleus]
MASPVVKMLTVTGRVQIESPYPGRDTFKNHSQCLAASKNTNERVPSSSEELAKLIQVPPVMRTRYLNRDIPIPTCHIPLTHYIRRLLARNNDKQRLSLIAATHDDNPPDSVLVGFSRSSSRTPRWKDFVDRLTPELARYAILSTVMLAVNLSLLSVLGVVNPNSPVGPIQIIVYCSVVSTTPSIVFSLALLNVYNNRRLLIARNVKPWGRSVERRRAWRVLPSRSLVWSIALFSVALAVQLFGRKEPTTVATLLVIILFVFMVMRIRTRLPLGRIRTFE